MDERADVQLTYKGPALKEGRMSVEDFCQSILGFAGVVEETSKVLNPDAPLPVVKVGPITTSGKEDFTINLSIQADHKDTTEPHE